MNLDQTLSTIKLAQHTAKAIKCFATSKELALQASASGEFYMVRVPVSRLSLSASSKKQGKDIVIDKNIDKLGKTVSGFTPKVAILSGHDLVANAIAEGRGFVNVWAGTAAIKKLSIMADDAISSNELQNKLGILIAKNYKSTSGGASDCCAPGGGAWIREIYPFENYLIFDWKGNQYKQAFVLDPVTRVVALAGKPVQVYEEYSEVPKGMTTTEGRKAQAIENIIQSSAALPVVPSQRAVQYYTTTFSQEQDFDPINSSDKPLGMLPGPGGDADLISFGAPSSEYANPPLKTMMNIEEALRLYLASVADGTHTPLPSPVFASSVTAGRYPNQFKECKIAASAIDEDVDIVDFLRWQNKQLTASTKLKEGLSASSFAYVGDTNDVSTWHCPVNTLDAINASLESLEASSYIPEDQKVAVADALLIHARKFSTNTRKKLAKKGVAEKDGSYPIANTKDLGNAVKDFNRSSNKTSTDRAHINERAKALGVKSPFKESKKSVKADGATNQLPGGYRPPPSMSADAEIAQNIVAKKKKNIKADMSTPMPSVSPTSKVSAGVQPASGRKKFRIGDKVKTKHGKGRVSDNTSRDHVEVTHMSGKVAVMPHSEVTKLEKK